jgi:mRNA interferase MazF
LIISNNKYNEVTEDIVVVAITSQLKDLDYSIVIEEKDLFEGKLTIDLSTIFS